MCTLWLIHAHVWQKPTTLCKANYPSIENKINSIKRNIKIKGIFNLTIQNLEKYNSWHWRNRQGTDWKRKRRWWS